MRHTGCYALGLTLLVPLWALAQSKPASPLQEDDWQGEAAEAKSQAVVDISDAAVLLLRKQVPEGVDWEDRPFGEVLDWLREQGNEVVNIIPRWPALQNEGVDEETAVTLKLKHVSVAEVLNETLNQLSDDGRLRYQAEENTIRISTQADFERKLILKVYNIADVVFKIPDFQRDAPQIDLTNQNRGGGGGGGAGGASGGQSVFQGASGGGGGQGQQQGQTEQEIEKQLTDLRNAIIETIAPDSWGGETNKNGPGRIRVFNRSLLILNTIEVHEELAGWFTRQ